MGHGFRLAAGLPPGVFVPSVPFADPNVTTKASTICEWDDAKNSGNLAKHGLDFADAEQVLTGPCITFVDDRFDYDEERLITWACSPAG